MDGWSINPAITSTAFPRPTHKSGAKKGKAQRDIRALLSVRSSNCAAVVNIWGGNCGAPWRAGTAAGPSALLLLLPGGGEAWSWIERLSIFIFQGCERPNGEVLWKPLSLLHQLLISHVAAWVLGWRKCEVHEPICTRNGLFVSGREGLAEKI